MESINPNESLMFFNVNNEDSNSIFSPNPSYFQDTDTNLIHKDDSLSLSSKNLNLLSFSDDNFPKAFNKVFNPNDHLSFQFSENGEDDDYEKTDPESAGKKLLFSVKIIDNTPKLSGQKRKNPENPYYKIHNNESKDNIQRKIQNHYMDFPIDVINYLIPLYINDSKGLQLLYLDYDAKKIVNKKNVEQIKTSSIKDIILSFPQTKKCTTYAKDHNKKVCEKICEKSEILKKFLDNNFLCLFEIYHKSEKWINLKEFGIEEEIPAFNVRSFKDLLEKPKNKKNKELIAKIKEFAEENYL